MRHTELPQVAKRETGHEYLTVRQVRLRPDLTRLLPIGEIDLVTAPILQHALSDTERSGVQNVVVDLTEVSFLALIGARVLHTAAEHTTGTDRRVALVASNPIVQRVLSLTHFEDVAVTYATVESAVSALAPTA